jgi:hypothetical protein
MRARGAKREGNVVTHRWTAYTKGTQRRGLRAWPADYRRRSADVPAASGVLRRRSPGALYAVGLCLLLASSMIPATSAAAKVKADWTAFFAGSTPAKRKIALLENGQKFAAIIDGQASSPLSKSVTAKVASVKVISPTKATVHYSLDLGGKPALTNQTGVAVLQGGTWKVGTHSFCGLLALEQTKAPACAGS